MGKQLRVFSIVKESIVDGPGIRMVVGCQGCLFGCIGCQNPNSHPFNGGYLIDTDTILDMAKKNPLLDGLSLSGGEPMEQPEQLYELAAKAKVMGLSIVTYTGYTYEYLTRNTKENENRKKLLSVTDILVDGKFDITKKSYDLRFRGSSNQRLIDVSKSLMSNEIVLADI